MSDDFPTAATMSQWQKILKLSQDNENFKILTGDEPYAVTEGAFDKDGIYTMHVLTAEDHKRIGYTEVCLKTETVKVFKLDEPE